MSFINSQDGYLNGGISICDEKQITYQNNFGMQYQIIAGALAPAICIIELIIFSPKLLYMLWHVWFQKHTERNEHGSWRHT